jgi:hypothetical protein
LRGILEHEPPRGFSRELVIIEGEFYSCKPLFSGVFSEQPYWVKVNSSRIGDGTFPWERCTLRVTIQNGQVIGIEVLRGRNDELLNPIIKEMKKKCREVCISSKAGER